MINISSEIFHSNSIAKSPKAGIDKSSAEALFCGLGENWWKQIIDGKYHQFGPMVFDQGLHIRTRVEPGFHASMTDALNFAKETLCEPLTVDFYCQVHRHACAHFKGRENQTDMHSSETGHFRINDQPPVTAIFGVKDIMEFALRDTTYPNKEQLIRDFQQIKTYLNNSNKIETLIADLKEEEMVKLMTPEQYLEFETLYQAKYVELIQDTQQLDAHAIPHFKLEDALVRLTYPQQDIYHLVEVIFDEFNQTMAKLDQESDSCKNPDEIAEKKLEAIASIYQKLEWLHPFRDGQGRTDLILLSKLLSENGFNPPILNEPYVSSYCSLKEWTAYLKEGIQLWKDLKPSMP